MSLKAIRKALERRLAQMTPVLATQWENVAFVPTGGVPYQRTHLLPAEATELTFDRLRREQGIFQVLLCYPIGNGTENAMDRAEAIRAAFPYGAEVTHGGVIVKIDATPAIASGYADDDRWCIPVRIRYYANI